jgi:hypothetical protein
MGAIVNYSDGKVSKVGVHPLAGFRSTRLDRRDSSANTFRRMLRIVGGAALAERLRRQPAKLMGKPARVRISQAALSRTVETILPLRCPFLHPRIFTITDYCRCCLLGFMPLYK